MAHEREPTLDYLLNEPIIRKVMKADGYTPTTFDAWYIVQVRGNRS